MFDFVVDGAIGKLVEGRNSVGVAGFDDEEGDEKATDWVEPGGVVKEVGTEDGGEGDDTGKGVDTVVYRVGG